MDFNEFYRNFKKQYKLDFDIEESVISQLYKYMSLLLEWNQKINLTAITKEEEIITKHFIDSLSILKHIKKYDKVIDIGTGAGFPGIPLKLVSPETEITLVDALNKRIVFLNEVIQKLNLEKVIAIHGRVEDLGREIQYRNQYDVAISRAVAPLNVLLEYMTPFVKLNGICICMKGPKLDEELTESKNAIENLGLEIKNIEKFNLAGTNMERSIAILIKTKQTDNKYPRKASDIKGKPL